MNKEPLKDLIAMSMKTKPSFTTQLEYITPELAAEWSAKRDPNRQKRMWWIEAMASAMRRGEWIPTHQGLAFITSGRNVDGQHRLDAIVKYGDGVWMLVSRGVSDDAFKVIDNGIKRSVADLSGLNKRLAETCRYVCNILYGGAVSTQQVLDVANSGVKEVHDELMNECGANKAYYASTAMRTAAIALVMDGVSKQSVYENYKILVTERFSEMSSALQALVRQVNSGKTESHKKSDVLARGLKVLNPGNAYLTKIQCSDAEIESARHFAKTVFKRALASEVQK